MKNVIEMFLALWPVVKDGRKPRVSKEKATELAQILVAVVTVAGVALGAEWMAEITVEQVAVALLAAGIVGRSLVGIFRREREAEGGTP